LDEKEAVEKALQTFPRLYYFVPPITPFSIDVLPDQVKILAKQLGLKKGQEHLAKKIKIKKPLDTILWLLDTLTGEQDNDGGYCLQDMLLHLTSRWTGVNFTKELNKLYAAGLIKNRILKSDKRKRELALTALGRKILEKIKDQRRELLSLLFKDQESSQMEMVTAALEVVAIATWPIMKNKEDSEPTESSKPASGRVKAAKHK
jgi:DNA-binding PadR family transcriptional regulator